MLRYRFVQWLSFPGATRLLGFLPEFDPEDRDLLERRALPPWQRRARRRDRRDTAIRKLAEVYLEMLPLVTGREMARLIAADCCRRPPPDDPRWPFVEEILANSMPNRSPTAGTVRDALTGLQRRRAATPFQSGRSAGRPSGGNPRSPNGNGARLTD